MKKYVVIVTLIIVASFTYTYMIAVLFAQNFESITYYFDSGIFVSVISCLIILIVYKIDILINKTISKLPASIFVINVFVSFVTSLFLFFIISWVSNGFIRNEWSLSFTFLKQQIIFVFYLLLLISSYHTVAYFTRATQIRNKKLKADNFELNLALNRYLKRIPSLTNKKTEMIPINNISFFNIEDGLVFAVTKDNKRKPITVTTLNRLEEMLNPMKFFRINRSEIVNIDEIESFEPYIKDRLAIKILKSNVILYTSNTKSSYFRTWILDGVN